MFPGLPVHREDQLPPLPLQNFFSQKTLYSHFLPYISGIKFHLAFHLERRKAVGQRHPSVSPLLTAIKSATASCVWSQDHLLTCLQFAHADPLPVFMHTSTLSVLSPRAWSAKPGGGHTQQGCRSPQAPARWHGWLWIQTPSPACWPVLSSSGS